MADGVLKYTEALYNSRIAALNGFVSDLGNILDSYDGLKSQITEFWEDSDAQQMQALVQTEMDKCNREMEDTQNQIKTLENIVANMQSTATNVGSIISDAMDILSNLES